MTIVFPMQATNVSKSSQFYGQQLDKHNYGRPLKCCGATTTTPQCSTLTLSQIILIVAQTVCSSFPKIIFLIHVKLVEMG